MKVGQKVVCIIDFEPFIRNIVRIFGAKFSDIKYPKKDEIYTIRGLEVVCPPTNTTGLLLNEIVNQKFHFLDGIKEPTFGESGFRVIDENFSQNVAEELEKQFVPLEIGEQVEEFQNH